MSSFYDVYTGEKKFDTDELEFKEDYIGGFNFNKKAEYDGESYMVKYCPKGGIRPSLMSNVVLKQIEEVESRKLYYNFEGNKIAYTFLEDAKSLDFLTDTDYQNLDRESVIDSLASKLLVADWNIKVDNFLYRDERKVMPIDFEHAMSYDNYDAFKGYLNKLEGSFNMGLTYEEIVARADELSDRVDKDSTYRKILSACKTSDRVVEEFISYMDSPGFLK